MSGNKNLQYDSWLSEVCERDAFRLTLDDQYLLNVNKADSEEAQQLKEAQARKVFIYSKLSVSAVNFVEFVENNGFHLVDTNVTLEKHYNVHNDFNKNCEIRFANANDEKVTVQLARHSFVYSRFHLDTRFPKEIADRVKAEWVRNYFKGSRGEWMVLAIKNATVVGFLQLLSNNKDTLIIDLIAVDQSYRRLGVAKDMIVFAERNLSQFKYVSVGTQIANVPSLKFYNRLGFFIIDSSYVFHYHYA